MLDLPLNVDFSGKVVVVTGAGGVLCGAMARAFAQAGAKVAALPQSIYLEVPYALPAEMKNICHGIEFGSASIKAVTIGSSFKPIPFGDYT